MIISKIMKTFNWFLRMMLCNGIVIVGLWVIGVRSMDSVAGMNNVKMITAFFFFTMAMEFYLYLSKKLHL